MTGVKFHDENGVQYGIKHIQNKPRVSAMPYSWDIAEGNIPNHDPVNKFGFNPDVAASLEEIWDGSATYEYLADDAFATMYISSDAAADQGLTYSVEGIDSDYNYSTVTVTTDGSNGRVFVALTSGASDDKWWRIFRVTNTSPTVAAGNIYVSKDNTDAGGDGIPDTATDIQAKIIIGNEQTLMALFTIPVSKIGFITKYYASTSSNKVTEVRLYVRPFGGVFNLKHVITINQTAFNLPFEFPISVAAKSDIKVRAKAAGSSGVVASGFDLWYES